MKRFVIKLDSAKELRDYLELKPQYWSSKNSIRLGHSETSYLNMNIDYVDIYKRNTYIEPNYSSVCILLTIEDIGKLPAISFEEWKLLRTMSEDNMEQMTRKNTTEREYRILTEYLHMAIMERNANPDVGIPLPDDMVLERIPIKMSQEVIDEVVSLYKQKYGDD